MVKVSQMLYGLPGVGWRPDSKMLYMTAKANGWTREAVHHFIKSAFNRESTKDLEWGEYNATMEVVGELHED